MLKSLVMGFITVLATTAPVSETSNLSLPDVNSSGAEWDGTLRRIRVPILMYHYVSYLPPGADSTRIGLTVSPDLFQAHLRYLEEQGYTTISFYELDRALMHGAALPSRPIILSFDDGYIDHYTHVFPALQSRGFSGTFFVITGRADANDPRYLNWVQIQAMANASMSMESHTKNHPDLRERDYDFLVYELLGSLESLAHYTGQPSRFFAYPAGQYDDMALRVLGELPVWRAITTQPGDLHTTDNRLEMPRLRVTGGMTVAQLAALIQRG